MLLNNPFALAPLEQRFRENGRRVVYWIASIWISSLLGYATELIQDVVTSVADKMKGQLKQLEDERLALGRDTARWNSDIRKTSALFWFTGKWNLPSNS